MKNPKCRFWLVLSILWIAVIFIFSAFSGEVSSVQSKSVLEVLVTIWPELTESTVRTAAHFLEYFILGWFTLGLFFNAPNFRVARPLLFCVLIALADETLQLHVTDRASEVMDVWMDFGGALVGSLISWGIFALKKSTSK